MEETLKRNADKFRDVPTKIRRSNYSKSASPRSSHSKKTHNNSTTAANADTSGDSDSGSDEQQSRNSFRPFRLRGNMIGVSRLYCIVTGNDEIKQCIDKTGWTQFLFHNVTVPDQRVVPALVKRWSPETHTFRLSDVELGITPYDFTSLTGIAVGMGKKLPPYSDSRFENYIATMNSYLPGFLQFQPEIARGRSLTVSALNKYICHIYNDGNILAPVEVISRAFCMYALGSVFFPNGNSTTGIGWLHYLIPMDEVGTYDWGTAILARIYLSLNRFIQDGMNGLYCFWQLIQYYIFEYLSSGPKLVREHDHLWPRMLRWRKDNRTSDPETVRNEVFTAEKQLEHGSPQSIRWTSFLPFKDKFPYVTEAYNVSLTRYMLLDPQCGAFWYLGERCLRQLTGLIVISADPPSPMTITRPASYRQFLRVVTEEPRYDKFSRQASQSEYDAYYSSVVRIGESFDEHVVDTGEVGNVAAHMPEITVPTPAAKIAEYRSQSSLSGRSIPSIYELLPDWLVPCLDSSGNVTMVPAARPTDSFEAPSATSYSREQWRKVYVEYVDYSSTLWHTIVDREHQMEQKNLVIKERDAEIAQLRQALNQSQ